MNVSLSQTAELVTRPAAYGLAAQTVVALPPSSLDPAAGQMRVYIGGVLVIREYDPTTDA